MTKHWWATQRGVCLVAMSLSLGTLVGCVRHGALVRAGSYRLQTMPNVTLLLPPGVAAVRGRSQTSVIALGAREPADAGGGCAIPGRVFALAPETAEGRWTMTSPSASGWDTPSLQAEAEGEWAGFSRALETIVARGCFPAGESVYTVRRRIVEAIPVPADRVLRYFYSLTASGFVDLQPGMQLGIETLNAATPGTSDTVRLAVVDRPPAGVGLEVIANGKGGGARASVVPKTFAAMPFLRLFLERAATGEEGPREAMLLGARSAADLDEATAVVLKRGERGCAGDTGAGKCLVFVGKGVSLLTAISVNGRGTFYAPGTTLSQVVDVIPEARRARALATLRVERRSAEGFVPIETPRTDEARFNLLLLNGDRIRWR